MKSAIISVLFWLCLVNASLTFGEYKQTYADIVSGRAELTDEIAQEMYSNFLLTFKGTSEIHSDHYLERYPIFKENLNTVIRHNLDSSKTWRMGINEYSDMTTEEFFAHFNLNVNEEQN